MANSLTKIQKGLRKKGINVEIKNMSLLENESREELKQEIREEVEKIKEWIEKEDWVMVAIINNRIGIKTEKLMKKE